MRNKSLAFASAGLLIALVFLLVRWSRHPSAADPAPPQTASSPAAPAVASSAPGTIQPPPGAPATTARPSTAATPAANSPAGTSAAPVPGASAPPPAAPSSPSSASAPPAERPGMIELDKTRRMIVDYHTLMGENPVGTNAEIMKAIMGGNPRQATLGPKEGQELNDKGELIDQWGTPYFFHQLSGDRMEIHSAGPDKTMGTRDDLLLR